MSFSVQLQPGDRSFTVKKGQTVLDAALEAGIRLSHECTRGLCRSCRGRIVAGTVKQRFTSLSPQDLAAGYALLCQSLPESDLVIEAKLLPPPVARAETTKALVKDLRRAAPDVMIVSLRIAPPHPLRYSNGQYIEVRLADGNLRKYSMATAAAAAGNFEVELHIRHSPGGLFTDHVFGNMKPKEILTIGGPHGAFVLRDSDKPAIFVAGGTGYAPIRTLLCEAFERMPQRPIWLYWGARTKEDLYRAEEPAKWAEQQPQFRFIPVLSEPLPQDDWQGRTGFVHRAVMDDFADLSGMQVYACGAPVMVDAAHTDFIASRGLPEEEFFSDSFLTQAELARNGSTP